MDFLSLSIIAYAIGVFFILAKSREIFAWAVEKTGSDSKIDPTRVLTSAIAWPIPLTQLVLMVALSVAFGIALALYRGVDAVNSEEISAWAFDHLEWPSLAASILIWFSIFWISLQ